MHQVMLQSETLPPVPVLLVGDMLPVGNANQDCVCSQGIWPPEVHIPRRKYAQSLSLALLNWP